MQQAMPGTKGEGIRETLLKRVRQGWCVSLRHQQEVAMRRQQRLTEVGRGN
jgi:hypothetical protein